MDEFAEVEKRARKWIWGCGGGCLSIVCLAGVAFLIFIHFLMKAVPVVPADLFVDPAATTIVAARIDADDRLMSELPYYLMLDPAIRRTFAPNAPGDVEFRPEQMESAVLEATPIQMVFLLAPRDDGTLDRAIAFSVHKGSLVIRLAMQVMFNKGVVAGNTQSLYKDARLLTTDTGSVTAFRTNNFMWADQKDLVKAWIDRLETRRGQEQEEERVRQPDLPADLDEDLRAAYLRLDPRKPLRIAASNAHGEIGRIVELLCTDADLRSAIADTGIGAPDVLSLGAQMDSLTAASGALRIALTCTDQAAATRLAGQLDPVVKEMPERYPLQNVTVRTDEATVRVDFELLNAPEHLGRLAGNFFRAARAMER